MGEDFTDYYTHDGARELAFFINDFWKQRGVDAGAHAYSLGTGFPTGSMGEGFSRERWGVRSRLVGGMPGAR